MTFQNGKEGPPKRKSPNDDKPATVPSDRRSNRRPPAGEVGNALRSVYQRTIAEDIPPEMLDLLGKLG